MSIQITTTNNIIRNGRDIGLRVVQRPEGTVVYSTDHSGRDYREHPMPMTRYTLSTEAGLAAFERDIGDLLLS